MIHPLVLVENAGCKVTYGILGSSPSLQKRKNISVTESKTEPEFPNADFTLNSGCGVTGVKGFLVCTQHCLEIQDSLFYSVLFYPTHPLTLHISKGLHYCDKWVYV